MPALVLLAAGMGSRFGGLKQLEPLGPSGETLMDYSVYDALRAGFDRIIFVIRKDFEAEFQEKVGAKYAGRVPVEYAFQDPTDLPAPHSVPEGRVKPWGTGHAARAARSLIHGPFCVINADDFYGRDSFAEMAGFLNQEAAAATETTRPLPLAMVGFRLKNTLSQFGSVARGVCGVNDQSELTSIREMTRITPTDNGAVNLETPDQPEPLTGEEIVSMNMWGFPAAFIPELEQSFLRFLDRSAASATAEFYIPTPVDELARSGQAIVKVLPTESPWFGVTYREEAESVRKEIAALVDSGEYPEKLWD